MSDPLDPMSEPSSAATAAGLRHFGLAAVAMLLATCVTYAHPALARFRPWVGGEAIPIVRMFVSAEHQAELPGFAEAGIHGTTESEEALSETLGAAVAASLKADIDDSADDGEGEAELDGPADSPPDVGSDGHGPQAAPSVRIEPSEYEGITQEIESADALGRFYAKLVQSAERKPGAITRVAHYGDSSVAADAITRTARRLLQRRFGDSGHGFILISRGDMHYGHHDIRHRTSDGWEMLSLVRDPLGKGLYGYGGVQARAKAGEYARFKTAKEGKIGRKVSRFELFFQNHRRGNKVKVRIDGKRREVINTRAKETTDEYRSFEVPDGAHELKLRTAGGGIAHLYGVVLERDTPGVVYDSLGLVGARAERLLNAEPTHMAAQLAHRGADLLVLGFGGNEAGSKWLQLDRYEQELTQVVTVMRAGNPEMDCLLFGPLDQGERDKRGRVVTIPILPQIVDVQRRVAKQKGCAFFDTYQAMGGENAIRRWYRSRPQLATSDLRHATPKGYEVVGTLYYKALLKAFSDYLTR